MVNYEQMGANEQIMEESMENGGHSDAENNDESKNSQILSNKHVRNRYIFRESQPAN